MTNSPYANAVFAVFYIVFIVNVMQVIVSVAKDDAGGGVLIPMAMLSLFVLSAAIMAYLFALEPLRMYLDGRKQEAVTFFVKTIGTFSCFTLFFVGALLIVSLN
jgi:hypothetical protein